ncbi:putative peptidase S10, serine carboxypeptidase, alpha/Beta hydrolase [Lupinus albus]|uniref:Putative peptidase S10, serine carboxypeptidase, alpha/Beta hydrolase n=1 Tax=Lupinus albus TaxID=3870 RepID=A0A6A4PES3_LUPAL|nr:putative peptidase S10, serine carboxypeptidase, alpha/Beta hydrolase [Lupinus albus]
MGLISDELYKSLEKNCRGDYIHETTRNELCSRDLESLDELTSGISEVHILEPKCEFASPKPFEVSWRRRSLNEKYPRNITDTHLTLPALNCRVLCIPCLLNASFPGIYAMIILLCHAMVAPYPF